VDENLDNYMAKGYLNVTTTTTTTLGQSFMAGQSKSNLFMKNWTIYDDERLFKPLPP
jgi:hypothetical protein